MSWGAHDHYEDLVTQRLQASAAAGLAVAIATTPIDGGLTRRQWIISQDDQTPMQLNQIRVDLGFGIELPTPYAHLLEEGWKPQAGYQPGQLRLTKSRTGTKSLRIKTLKDSGRSVQAPEGLLGPTEKAFLEVWGD